MTYFLDTNIISYLLEGRQSVLDAFIKCASKNTIKIPIIVYYEIKRGLLYKNAAKQLAVFERFCSVYGVINISLETIQLASSIYSELKHLGQIIEDADILIGAAAIEHNAILATNNIQHLSRIKNLKTEQWFM